MTPGGSAFRAGGAHHPSTIHCCGACGGMVGYDDAAADDQCSNTHTPRDTRIDRVPEVGAVSIGNGGGTPSREQRGGTRKSADEVTQEEKAGAAQYSRAPLPVYDTVVLGWSNTLVWHCPSERLLAHYNLAPRWPAPRHRPRNRLVPPARHLPDPEPACRATRPQAQHMADDRRTPRRPWHQRGSAHRHRPRPISRGHSGCSTPWQRTSCCTACPVPGWRMAARSRTSPRSIADDGVFFGPTILDPGVHHTRATGARWCACRSWCSGRRVRREHRWQPRSGCACSRTAPRAPRPR